MRVIKGEQIETAVARWRLMKFEDSSIPKLSEMTKVTLPDWVHSTRWEDLWEMPDALADLIEQLNGPYWRAIILAKIARIKGTEDEG